MFLEWRLPLEARGRSPRGRRLPGGGGGGRRGRGGDRDCAAHPPLAARTSPRRGADEAWRLLVQRVTARQAGCDAGRRRQSGSVGPPERPCPALRLGRQVPWHVNFVI